MKRMSSFSVFFFSLVRFKREILKCVTIKLSSQGEMGIPSVIPFHQFYFINKHHMLVKLFNFHDFFFLGYDVNLNGKYIMCSDMLHHENQKK